MMFGLSKIVKDLCRRLDGVRDRLYDVERRCSCCDDAQKRVTHIEHELKATRLGFSPKEHATTITESPFGVGGPKSWTREHRYTRWERPHKGCKDVVEVYKDGVITLERAQK